MLRLRTVNLVNGRKIDTKLICEFDSLSIWEKSKRFFFLFNFRQNRVHFVNRIWLLCCHNRPKCSIKSPPLGEHSKKIQRVPLAHTHTHTLTLSESRTHSNDERKIGQREILWKFRWRNEHSIYYKIVCIVFSCAKMGENSLCVDKIRLIGNGNLPTCIEFVPNLWAEINLSTNYGH